MSSSNKELIWSAVRLRSGALDVFARCDFTIVTFLAGVAPASANKEMFYE